MAGHCLKCACPPSLLVAESDLDPLLDDYLRGIKLRPDFDEEKSRRAAERAVYSQRVTRGHIAVAPRGIAGQQNTAGAVFQDACFRDVCFGAISATVKDFYALEHGVLAVEDTWQSQGKLNDMVRGPRVIDSHRSPLQLAGTVAGNVVSDTGWYPNI